MGRSAPVGEMAGLKLSHITLSLSNCARLPAGYHWHNQNLIMPLLLLQQAAFSKNAGKFCVR